MYSYFSSFINLYIYSVHLLDFVFFFNFITALIIILISTSFECFLKLMNLFSYLLFLSFLIKFLLSQFLRLLLQFLDLCLDYFRLLTLKDLLFLTNTQSAIIFLLGLLFIIILFFSIIHNFIFIFLFFLFIFFMFLMMIISWVLLNSSHFI